VPVVPVLVGPVLLLFVPVASSVESVFKWPADDGLFEFWMLADESDGLVFGKWLTDGRKEGIP
jgi:hypothetical protein